ncbi:MAG: glycerophosphodiester phosphodiesterase family protein [Caldilineaceae bacterium]
MSAPQIFAHRGAKAVAPENTLPAFAQALEMNVAGIELDVHCSKDGKLVVIHDESLARTTNGKGNVGDYSAAELAKLDAGSHFHPQFAGVGIPTLNEVFDLVGQRCLVNVEVKTADPLGGDQVEPLLAMIEDRGLYDQVIVSSFNPVSLIKVRYLNPKVRLGLLYYLPLLPWLRNAWFTPIMQPEAVHPYSQLIDDEHMRWARSRHCAVNTWTVNEIDEAKRLAALGVDVIMSDVPDQIMAALAASTSSVTEP